MEETHPKQLKTGTTTVGVVCKNAVVLGADKKATMGYLVASKEVLKVVQIDDHIGMTIAGAVSDAQALQKYIHAELKLYQFNEGRRIPISAAAHLVSNILYSRRFYPYMVQLIVGGYDKTGPHVFSFDPTGSVQEESEYFSTGSGSVMALGVLEDKYEKNMPVEEAKKLVIRAVRAATKRDIASGGKGIDIIIIDEKGYHHMPENEVKKIAE
jgi:proteasome beta subunit